MTISISNSWHCALTCSVQRLIWCVRNYEELIKVIFLLKKILFLDFPVITEKTTQHTDYRRPEKKQSSLHGQKFTPTPTFSDMAEAYFVCHVSPIFQISLIYAFIGCPQSVILSFKLFSFSWCICPLEPVCCSHTMAIRVVEFSNGGYKIRKIFASE